MVREHIERDRQRRERSLQVITKLLLHLGECVRERFEAVASLGIEVVRWRRHLTPVSAEQRVELGCKPSRLEYQKTKWKVASAMLQARRTSSASAH
jgi:hypothetical protein